MSKELLRIEGLHAWYGESHILHGVDLTVNEGEVVCLLGRNGAGRTTTMRAIVGLTGARKGSIRINGEEAIKLPPHKVAKLGVGYCPEERGIFASLSCGRSPTACRRKTFFCGPRRSLASLWVTKNIANLFTSGGTPCLSWSKPIPTTTRSSRPCNAAASSASSADEQ